MVLIAILFLITSLLSLLMGGMVAYLVAVGILTALVFGYDKFAAMSGLRRIPERGLLGLSLVGGAPFALVAMVVLRHKTRKPQIFIPIFVVALIQVGLLVVC